MSCFLTVKRDVCRKVSESFIKFWKGVFSSPECSNICSSVSDLEIPNAYALSFPLTLLRITDFKKTKQSYLFKKCVWFVRNIIVWYLEY